MAKRRTAAAPQEEEPQTIELETPVEDLDQAEETTLEEAPQLDIDLSEGGGSSSAGGDKKVTFDKAIKDFPMEKAKNQGQNTLNIDLTEGVTDEGNKGQMDIHPNKWVIAKFLGCNSSPDGNHSQVINGKKAVFPLDKPMLTQFKYVKSAFQSGYTDYKNDPRPGAKHKRMVANAPRFDIQANAVPEQFQEGAEILKFVDAVKAQYGATIQFAHTQF